jgi:orotate phosphoribosyltransferase
VVRNGDARARLLAELREHALVIGEVVLTSGATAQYLVDAKRAILRRDGFEALAELVARQAREWSATAVGGMTMGADPIACAALAGGADVKAFFVRKDVKQHGLARRIEGPLLEPGDRCMLVEDVVTTGGSTLRALDAVRAEGHEICGVLAVCDRLAGGAEAIRETAGVPYVALTTIDEVYPERPDRCVLSGRPRVPENRAEEGVSSGGCSGLLARKMRQTRIRPDGLS